MPAPPTKPKYFDMGRSLNEQRADRGLKPVDCNSNKFTINIQPFKFKLSEEEIARFADAFRESVERSMGFRKAIRGEFDTLPKIVEVVDTPYGNLYRRKLRIRR